MAPIGGENGTLKWDEGRTGPGQRKGAERTKDGFGVANENESSNGFAYNIIRANKPRISLNSGWNCIFRRTIGPNYLISRDNAFNFGNPLRRDDVTLFPNDVLNPLFLMSLFRENQARKSPATITV